MQFANLQTDYRPNHMTVSQDCDSLFQVLDTHIAACVAATAAGRASSTQLPDCPVDDTFYVAPRELAASDSVEAVHQRERAEITKAIMVGVVTFRCAGHL